jgi:hypothetical protein
VNNILILMQTLFKKADKFSHLARRLPCLPIV